MTVVLVCARNIGYAHSLRSRGEYSGVATLRVPLFLCALLPAASIPKRNNRNNMVVRRTKEVGGQQNQNINSDLFVFCFGGRAGGMCACVERR